MHPALQGVGGLKYVGECDFSCSALHGKNHVLSFEQPYVLMFRLISGFVLRYTLIKFSQGSAMSAAEIENALRTAAMSLEMEGQHVDAPCRCAMHGMGPQNACRRNYIRRISGVGNQAVGGLTVCHTALILLRTTAIPARAV